MPGLLMSTGSCAIRWRCINRSSTAKSMLRQMAAMPTSVTSTLPMWYTATPATIVTRDATVSRLICIGMRKKLSMISVKRGATLRAITIMPSELYCIATIEETSIAAKSIGTVRPQRKASRIDPMCTLRGLKATVRTVKSICMSTSVIGRRSAETASLLKTAMPAELIMYAQHEVTRLVLPPCNRSWSKRREAGGSRRVELMSGEWGQR
mmetsp:Transcript_8946/g.19849  ORF Transcript_8946/g.19849 Transcript_8946/m.19849 type:complete len:209 (+) Transcript_8946:968-1594(+)